MCHYIPRAIFSIYQPGYFVSGQSIIKAAKKINPAKNSFKIDKLYRDEKELFIISINSGVNDLLGIFVQENNNAGAKRIIDPEKQYLIIKIVNLKWVINIDDAIRFSRSTNDYQNKERLDSMKRVRDKLGELLEFKMKKK